MKNNPFLSVITVCYNAEATIERTINSVIAQEDCEYEYIIVDGLSSDKTINIIEKHKKNIDFFISEKDSGIYDAMNKGIKMAKGKYLLFLNADDYLEEGVLAKVNNHCINMFSDGIEPEIIYGNAYYVNGYGEKRIVYAGNLEDLQIHDVIVHQATFISKSLFEKTGLYDTRYKIAGDYDFFLNSYNIGAIFSYVNLVICSFSDNGISNRRYDVCIKEAYEVALKYANENKDIINKINKNYEYELRNSKCIKNMDLIMEGDALINKSVLHQKNVYIFGVGNYGRKIYDVLKKCGVRVKAFIDNDPDQWNQLYRGTQILDPKVLEKDKQILVVVSVTKFLELIENQIKSINPKINVISVYDAVDLLIDEKEFKDNER